MLLDNPDKPQQVKDTLRYKKEPSKTLAKGGSNIINLANGH